MDSVAKVERFRSNHLQDATAERRSTRRIGRAAHDQELFATPAHQHVRLTDDRGKPLRHQLQQPVSRGMAVPVVYFLEEIHADHDEDEAAMIHLPTVTSDGARISS